MAFFDFFWKEAKRLADTSAQNLALGINGQFAETRNCFSELSERLRRIETRQKETSLQLDEIDNSLQSGSETVFIDALIALADTIGDFYYYAAQEEQNTAAPMNSTAAPCSDEDESGFSGGAAEWHDGADDEDDGDDSSPLLKQARMMWNAARNAVETAGLEIIDAAGEPFDFRLHSAQSTEQDKGLPNGYVIKTLKYGYIYREEIVRRAVVVVNKVDVVNRVDTANNADMENNIDGVDQLSTDKNNDE